ncbi:S-adenosyl-L-methionine-dependent methyltransferase [Xylaria cf. heliscus]|nr:S-adenosyl-L-methionine-dependent methyltransferase [Xylaria cf. heliscus]
MTSVPSLSSLAHRLLKSAEKLDAPPDNNNQGIWSEELRVVRSDILEVLQEIQIRVQDPVDLLEHHTIHYNSFSCFHWLLHFNIFTHVPLDKTPIPYTSLATLASVPLKRLQSVARMAMLSGLFTEPEPTLIAHSRLSLSFATDSRLRDWGAFVIKYGAPAAQTMVAATERWGCTEALNETAYNVFTGSSVPLFEHMKQVPGMSDLFARYMESTCLSYGSRLEHLLKGYDWNGLTSRAHIVDVGGSKGFASIALAHAHPGFLFTVQDTQTGIGSHSEISNLDSSVSSRIRFVVQDFFDPQPATQADWPPPDIYLLRKILHDWPQHQSRKILSQLAVALRDGQPTARILIMDAILPAAGTVGKLQEAKLRVRDLTMAQHFNSYERGLEEWEELLEGTVPKLKLSSWSQSPESSMAVMEVVLDC